MPKNQSTLAIKLRRAFVVVVTITSLFLSCKSDKKSLNTKEAFDGPDVVNFLINGKEKPGKDQIPLDITLLQYEENKQNEEHVMYVPILDSVYLTDVSRFNDGAPGERQWYVDGELLPSNAKEVAYFTELPGPSKVILKFTDYINVSKGVFFTDEVDYTDDIAEDSGGDDTYQQLDSDQDQGAEAVASSNNSYSQPPKPATSTYSPPPKKQTSTVAKKSTPPPPPPKRVEIQNVDFSVSKTNVETGEKILFRDLSSPAVAVKNRVWDWGDGVTTPTKGSTFGYSFSRPGTYTVKLCLNYTSKCASKQITVTKAADPVVVAAPKSEPKKAADKPKVSRVAISGPSSSIVGKPIEIVDDSYPQSAVSSREWYINGKKENYITSKFSKTFDQPGTYNIKLCVNGDQSSCQTKVVTIEKKPPPPPAKEEVAAAAVSDEEFFAMAASRTGLRTSQRCPEDEIKWSTGVTEVTLTPTVPMELMNARIFGKKVALAKATLKSSDGKIKKVINNIQILPGPSSVEFGDFGVILRPGTKYFLTIEPMPGSVMELEDGGGCNTNFAADDRLAVSYKDNVMTLYNIKFGY